LIFSIYYIDCDECDSITIEMPDTSIDLPATITSILREYPSIYAAYLYGSHATGDARAQSDIDVAVMAEPALQFSAKKELYMRLMEATDRDIDLTEIDATTDPVFAHEVFNTGTILIDTSPTRRIADETNLELRYFDQAHFRRTVHQMTRERLGLA
jgi:predicted nucleotidyltransferase